MKIRSKLSIAISIVITLSIAIFMVLIMNMEKSNTISSVCKEQQDYFSLCYEKFTDMLLHSSNQKGEAQEGTFKSLWRNFVSECDVTLFGYFKPRKSVKYAVYNEKQKRYWYNDCGYNPDSVLSPSDNFDNVIVKVDDRSLLFSGQRCSNGLVLYTMADIGDKYDYLDKIQNMILITGIVMCLSTLLVTQLLTGRMLHSLKALERFGKHIATGNYGEQIEIKSNDEIKDVAVCFNEMSQKISQDMVEKEQELENREMLINALSHELKTPITSIKACSQTLLMTKLSTEQQEELLIMMDQECARMEKLSQKMMQLLIIKKMDHSSFTEIDIMDLLQRLQHNMQSIYEKRNIQIKVETNKKSLYADEDLFYEMVSNLVDNSAKACEDNSYIEVKIIDDSLIVADHGCGMKEEYISKVLMPFYMIDKSRSRKLNGVGLGLAICSKIVDLHGYKIQIDSILGEGTTVVISNLDTK